MKAEMREVRHTHLTTRTLHVFQFAELFVLTVTLFRTKVEAMSRLEIIRNNYDMLIMYHLFGM